LIFELLALLRRSEAENEEKRLRLAEVEADAAQMDNVVEELRLTRQSRDDLEELQRNVQLVIEKTAQLKSRTDQLIEEMWSEIREEKLEIPDSMEVSQRKEGRIVKAERDQRAAREHSRRNRLEDAENRFSVMNTLDDKREFEAFSPD
jgi:hypothetical protein